MLHDIAPHVFSNAYRPKTPEPSSIALFVKDRKLLLSERDGAIRFPRIADLPSSYRGFTYAFAISNTAFFLVDGEMPPSLEGFEMVPMSALRRASPHHLAFAGSVGCQLAEWYRSRRFCGRCGTPVIHDEKERMLRCPKCGQMEYPKLCPAVIVGVCDGDKLLLTKYSGREYKDFALIAGFAEFGEPIEDTVHREVLEEVGVRVRNIRYYKSQPWPFSDTLLMGFFADLDGDPHIQMDRDELSTALWVPRHELSIKHNNLSLTNEMILRFSQEYPC